MYIGIDLGTSGVKAILLSEQGTVLASQTEKLTVSRPPFVVGAGPVALVAGHGPGDSRPRRTAFITAVKAIGLAGQMHGATLLDNENQVLASGDSVE
jgi:xylulokinase